MDGRRGALEESEWSLKGGIHFDGDDNNDEDDVSDGYDDDDADDEDDNGHEIKCLG